MFMSLIQVAAARQPPQYYTLPTYKSNVYCTYSLLYNIFYILLYRLLYNLPYTPLYIVM